MAPNAMRKAHRNQRNQSRGQIGRKAKTSASDDSSKRQAMTDSESLMSGSRIVSFYKNRSVLITGASGFIGKVLIEKLIRSCPEIDKIFVLIRPKWNKKPQERLDELLKIPLFDTIKHVKSLRGEGLTDRVIAVEGDVTERNLGLSDESLQRIIDEVSVVFHSAATIKFDEPLKQSIRINIAGTRNLVEVCRRLRQLAALVHVSTAYANCQLDEVDEFVYPVDMDPDNLMQMGDWLDQDTLQEMKLKLLKTRPNTYTYTKALAEYWLIKNARDLPLAICRPSIVVASWKEPVEGWIDNVNGPTGVILGAGKGLIRSMYANMDCVADLIPVDIVINMIITLGWFANIYRRHRQINDSNEYLSESCTGTSSRAMSSSGDDDEKPLSFDDLEQHMDSLTRRAPDHSLCADQMAIERTRNDSNNNDSENNNSLSSYNRNDVASEVKHPKNNQLDLMSPRKASGKTVTERDTSNLQVLTPIADEAYGSASGSPDANSTISSTSDCLSSLLKQSSPDAMLYTDCNNHTIDVTAYRQSSPLSLKARIRLAEQREAAALEGKLREFRQMTQNKLAACNLPGYLADIPVFHCTSGLDNPVTWGQIQEITMKQLVEYPSESTFRYPRGSFTARDRLDKFYRISLHYVPAYVVDAVIRMRGGRPTMVKIFTKFDQAAKVLKAFTSKQWVFRSDNTEMLVRELMFEEDRRQFYSDIVKLNWTDFFRGYVLGVRQFMLKEPMSNIEQARKNLKITYYRNLGLELLFFALIAFLFFKA